jgi:RNA polymerase sigma factor (sigma-70 family)
MSKQNNFSHPSERKIYIKHLHQWIPVSKEFYDDYYRDITAYRKKQQSHGCCSCPASKRFLCDMDCWTCPYQTSGEVLSLNHPIVDDEGNVIENIDLLPDYGISVESIVENRELLSRLFEALQKISPTYATICLLSAQGKSQREIAKILGVKSQSTLNYQLKQALTQLHELMKDLR